MNSTSRKVLLGSLCLAFVIQTTLVYADPVAREPTALSPLAQEGRKIWLSHNCQACHQIYGFGGFLGPDLTNRGAMLDRSRLDEVLTKGTKQMPPFHLAAREIDAIQAWFQALDATGIGQARKARKDERAANESTISEAFASLSTPAASEEAESRAAAERGSRLFRKKGCIACHVLFRSNSIGPLTAPDLSTVAKRLTRKELVKTLLLGRPMKGMPPPDLGDEQREDLLSFFAWLSEQREALLEARGPMHSEEGLPWFEFR